MYTGDWYISWLLWLAQMKGMDMAWLKKYPLFLASYTAPLMYIPYLVTLDQVVIWQHISSPTVNQQVNGFPWKERVDMDYWIKSAAEYEVFAGRTGKPAPVELSEAEKVAILWKGHPELWPAG